MRPLLYIFCNIRLFDDGHHPMSRALKIEEHQGTSNRAQPRRIKEDDRACLRYLRNGGPRVSAMIVASTFIASVMYHGKSRVPRINIRAIVLRCLINFIGNNMSILARLLHYLRVCCRCIEKWHQGTNNRCDGDFNWERWSLLV